jgi:hypothetical protein
MKLNEAILSESNLWGQRKRGSGSRKEAAKTFKKYRTGIDKVLKEIEKKLKGVDAFQKKNPESWEYTDSLGSMLQNLKDSHTVIGDANEAAYNQANRGSTGEDPSGAGEDRNQRGTRDHARGTAPEGEKWIKANPRNEW